MSSIQQYPSYLYLIHNKIIAVDFEVPFLRNIKPATNPNFKFNANNNIFNNEFKDGYKLNKNEAFYSKSTLIQTKHKKNGEIEYFLDNDLSPFDKSFKLLSHPMALSLVLDDNYVLHSSAIEVDKKGYIFIGPSGSGKSYIVNSLLKYGRFMTEDILSCSYVNEEFFAAPSIPVIKLQQDIECTQENTKFEIMGDTRNRKGYLVNNFDYKNLPVKIEACFILRESKAHCISPCNEIDAYKNLFLNSFCANPKNECLESEKNLMAKISLFLKTVPIYHYERTKDHNVTELLKFLKL